MPFQLTEKTVVFTAEADADNEDLTWWPRQALLHYAVLRTTNAARRSGRLAGQEAHRAIWQAALEGCKGSKLFSTIAEAGSRARKPEQPSDEANVSLAIQTSATTTTRTNAASTIATPSTLSTASGTAGAGETTTERFRRVFAIFLL